MTITQHKLLALFGGAVVALITISVNALFLSFNTMGNIIFYGTGHYTVTEQIESSTILDLIIWGLWIVTAFTWWKVSGLL